MMAGQDPNPSMWFKEERAVRTWAVVAGLEQALEKEVRFDHRVAPAHSTGTSRGKTTAADKRVSLAPEVVVPARQIPVKSVSHKRRKT